jgi:hypothetical protein
MDLLKSIIARDVDGDVVNKHGDKVLKTKGSALDKDSKPKAAPRPSIKM